jgi:hypothetical protein
MESWIVVGELQRSREVDARIDRQPRQIDDPNRAAQWRGRNRGDHVVDPRRHQTLAVLVVVIAQPGVGERQQGGAGQQRGPQPSEP